MKIIKLGNEARTSLKKGIDAVADILKTTLGPHGKNSTIGRVALGPLTTNDGVSIAKHIELEDEIENLGAQVIRQVTLETDKEAGDGTTTSAVIAQKLANDVFARLGQNTLVKSSESQIGLMRAISEALEGTIKELDKKSKKVTSKKTLEDIALTSVENEDVGKLIADIVWKTGENGSVLFEESQGTQITGEITDGYHVDIGYASPYFGRAGKAKVSKPYFYVTNDVVASPTQIEPVIAQLDPAKDTLIFVAKDYSEQMLNMIVSTKLTGQMNIYALAVPDEEKIKDIASAVGATFYDVNIPQEPKKEGLGSAKEVVMNIQESTILEGKGDTKDRIKEIEGQKGDNKFANELMDRRIAALTGKSGIIRVGANSETERDYWMLKVEDAISATKNALKEGVVKGGGATLYEIGTKHDNILSEALKAPYLQIQQNAGGKLDIPDTVLDPVKVTKTALTRACSVVGTLITTESVIVDKREDNENKD